MTTKDTERKALTKIENIVKELGEDSYVGTALEGCLDIARENIENDWACSMKQRVDAAENSAEEWKSVAESRGNESDELRGMLDSAKAENEQLYSQIKARDERIVELRTNYFAARDERDELLDAKNELTEQLKAKDLEIVTLKAKLYDLLTK